MQYMQPRSSILLCCCLHISLFFLTPHHHNHRLVLPVLHHFLIFPNVIGTWLLVLLSGP
ncbi:hypothetical protein BDZ91DRAFT_709283 [Kalaharituber pfeilii]|nr:hypothetical protein BDZ91DRAFT_709283 [Kalaharituber pfeilii]